MTTLLIAGGRLEYDMRRDEEAARVKRIEAAKPQVKLQVKSEVKSEVKPQAEVETVAVVETVKVTSEDAGTALLLTANTRQKAPTPKPVAPAPAPAPAPTPAATTWTLTAYCSCVQCCGKSDGITASGAKATAGRTVAVPSSIPFGTVVVINGHEYVAEDRGGGIKGNKLDIYFDSHEAALQFGRQTTTDVIIK